MLAESVQGGVGTFNLNNAVPTTSGTITFHVSQSDAAAAQVISPMLLLIQVDNQVVWVGVEDVKRLLRCSQVLHSIPWTLDNCRYFW